MEGLRLFPGKGFQLWWLPFSRERVKGYSDVRKVRYETSVYVHKADERVEIRFSTRFLASTLDYIRNF